MRNLAGLLVLAASAASALPELSIAKRDAHGAASPLARGVVKRSGGNGGTVGTNIFDVLSYSTGGAYYANVTVGTPPQQQLVIVDSGSSDLYFDASSAASCTQPSSNPHSCRGGTFAHDKSSTYKLVDPAPAFSTTFGNGSTAVGPFAQDVIGIGDVLINNVQFGVAEQVNSTTGFAIGLMGVGYSANEASRSQYPNMPEVLQSAGIINSRLYSVFLADIGAISGSILFGGIDTSRYTGDLVTIDLLPDLVTNQIDQFITTVTGLSANINNTLHSIISGGSPDSAAYNTSDPALPVLLDTGSSAWSVPAGFYSRSIDPLFPYVDIYGRCSCSHASSPDTLIIEFARAVNITIPARELIVPLYDPATNLPVPYRGQEGGDACGFMLAPAQPPNPGFMTLGDAVLRSMYVVFDLDNGQVSLAQAADSSSHQPPDIRAVPAGPSGVASAVSNVKPASANQTVSIAPGVASGTAGLVYSTASSTIGTATGSAAVPADALATGASKGAAARNLRAPGLDGMVGAALVVGGAVVLGVGLVL